MTHDEWRPVVGHEGHYEVSRSGRVRSLDRTIVQADGKRRFFPGKELTPTLATNGGYHQVEIARKSRRVHLLVLAAFVGQRPRGLVARHLDGDPTNNRVSNLTWGTQTDNLLDKQEHGTDYQLNKTHCPQGHPYSAENTRYNVSRNGHPSRKCRVCHRASEARRARARRAVAA